MPDWGHKKRTAIRAAVLGSRAGAALHHGWREWLSPFSEWVAREAAKEVEAARLAPWLTVFFGTGILLYFAAPNEPSLVGPLLALILFTALCRISRERPFAFVLLLSLAAISAGFTTACLRAAYVEHKVLTRPTATLTLTGFVEARDATERSDRAVIRLTGASGRGAGNVPRKFRVAMRRGFAPNVGDHIELRAQLRPLLGPTRPGGYDFARGAYFQKLGATGLVYGRPKVVSTEAPVPGDIRVYAAMEKLRWTLANRIRAVLPGESGSIAVALVTGIRDTIPAEANEAMRVSGLYHVISISGLHMALVAGVLFAAVRGGLALMPGLALRRPIKKWAAVAALIAVTFYLVLSGADHATQRAWIMISIVLVGVLMDRLALSVRTLAAAAFGVMLIQPEALLNPGFQMSFAATLALIALYERMSPMLAEPPSPGQGAFARFSERAWRWLLLGIATSLVAGLATTAYVAFYFHRVAPYGVLANLLAMPVISFLIMPAALLSVLLLPFGYDALGWQLMGFGIEVMLKVARFVAELPGAEGRVAAFGAGALLVATAGLFALAIPISGLRLIGIPMLALAFMLASNAPRPDVLVDAEADIVAVRGADGKLSILDARRDRLSAESWLAADADGRKARDASLADGFRCDPLGCTATLAGGDVIAVPRQREAWLDDCNEAALIVSRFYLPDACHAPQLDRRALNTAGAVSLRRVDGKWIAEPVRSPSSDRPWFGRAQPPDPNALARLQPKRETPAAAREESFMRPDESPVPELEEDEAAND